jgi:phospholipid/cholesterol/gamma-HCH transport system substrate-binding protein
MSRNVIETVMGAVVLIIAVLFLFFAYSTSQVRAVRGYEITAKFSRIEGIREGGDVRVSGIKVGTVVSETLDPTTYDAIVKLSVDPSVKLPTDTVAEIQSSGLLGDKFLALVPGGADDMLKPGSQIASNPPISLEDLIRKFAFGSLGGDQKGGDQKGSDQKGGDQAKDGGATPKP